ncbi:MAG: hypothetical protein AABX11_06820 [Nanoarchaeota archaeon]
MVNKINQKAREYMTNTRRTIELGVKVGLVFLVTNLSSFSTVAMEKYISNYSKEQAAVVNSLSAVPGLYDVGFHMGHKVFYKDDNFLKTKEKATGFKNIDILPRAF